MWEIEFYTKPNGRCPTEDFLSTLSPKKDLPYINLAFEQLEEYGYKADRPLAAYLGNDIYELRIKTINGQFRFLYFFFVDQKIIITHGFKKKQKDVPLTEINRAIDYRTDYLKANERER